MPTMREVLGLVREPDNIKMPDGQLFEVWKPTQREIQNTLLEMGHLQKTGLDGKDLPGNFEVAVLVLHKFSRDPTITGKIYDTLVEELSLLSPGRCDAILNWFKSFVVPGKQDNTPPSQ